MARRWDVDPDELASAASGALRLPDEPSSDVLTAWLGIADDFEPIDTSLRKWIAGLVDGSAPGSNQ